MYTMQVPGGRSSPGAAGCRGERFLRGLQAREPCEGKAWQCRSLPLFAPVVACQCCLLASCSLECSISEQPTCPPPALAGCKQKVFLSASASVCHSQSSSLLCDVPSASLLTHVQLPSPTAFLPSLEHMPFLDVHQTLSCCPHLWYQISCILSFFPDPPHPPLSPSLQLILYPTAIGSEPQDPTVYSYPHWMRAMLGHAASNLRRPWQQGSRSFDGASHHPPSACH